MALGGILNEVMIIAAYLIPTLQQVGVTEPVKIAGINRGLAAFNYFMAIVGMLAAFCIITPLAAAFNRTLNFTMANAFNLMLFVYYGSYDIGWTPLPFLHGAEILPYIFF
uniref:Putative hexose transporter protein n=1 Tax=Moniliophthora roreri TaxID=221103 RepID=A0A0W0ETS5_MONRR